VLNAGSTLTIDAVAFKGGKSPKSTAVETVSGDTACMSDGAVIDASDTANNFKSSDFCAAGEIVAQSVGDGVPNNVKAACGTCMYHRCSVKRNDEAKCYELFGYTFLDDADKGLCMCSCCRVQCGMQKGCERKPNPPTLSADLPAASYTAAVAKPAAMILAAAAAVAALAAMAAVRARAARSKQGVEMLPLA